MHPFLSGVNESPHSRWSFSSPRSSVRRRELEPLYLNDSNSSDDDDVTLHSETLNSTASSSTATTSVTSASTPNKSGIYTSLFGNSSSARKRKHSSNRSQPSPSSDHKRQCVAGSHLKQYEVSPSEPSTRTQNLSSPLPVSNKGQDVASLSELSRRKTSKSKRNDDISYKQENVSDVLFEGK